MKAILLTQRKIVLVDDADYDWLNRFRWYALKGRYTFYAVRNVYITKKKRGLERMHRVILGLQPGDNRQCDHRDGNGLNNQRGNLRICTHVQNSQSQRSWKIGTSRYKGVYWHQSNHTWCSQIGVNKKQIHLGSFDSGANAARAYDLAARKRYGNFALTNEKLGLLK